MMQIILIEKKSKLGEVGDQVTVKEGYARNFLLPKGLAIPATKQNIEFFEKRRKEIENKKIHALNRALERANKVAMLGIINITIRAGKTGRLFGSIGTRDIVTSLAQAGIEITKNQVFLPNGIIRSIGEHKVIIKFAEKITEKLIVNVLPKLKK